MAIKNFGERKVVDSSSCKKKVDFVCFPAQFVCLGAKKNVFCLKMLYNGGKQTNSYFFEKNENFECFRCFSIPQVLWTNNFRWFYDYLKFLQASPKMVQICCSQNNKFRPFWAMPEGSSNNHKIIGNCSFIALGVWKSI